MNIVERVEKGLDRNGLLNTWNELSEQTDYVRGLIMIEAKKDCLENTEMDWNKYLSEFKVNGKIVTEQYANALIRSTKEKVELKEHLSKTKVALSTCLKETEAELRLPDSASTQMELKGSNAIEKAKNYQEVIEATGKDKPSAGDIRQFNQQKKQSQELYNELKNERTINSNRKSDSQIDEDNEVLALNHMTETSKESFEEWCRSKGYSIVFNKPKLNTSMYGLKDPTITDLYKHSDEWKPLFKKLSKVLHPDKGGSSDDMQMLNRINSLMVNLNETLEYNRWEDRVLELKKQWKKSIE